MKKLLLLSTLASLLILITSNYCYSQAVGISGTGSAPDPSALLDVDATGMTPKKGLLIPRLTTTERDAIATGCSCTPAEGLMIFNTTTKCLEMYVNGAWNTGFCPSACTPPAAPTANAASGLACTSFTANWSASAGATSYYLDVSLNSGFSSFVSGYNNLNVGNVTSSGVTGLAVGTTYYYRLRAATACASGNSNTITTGTTAAPAAAGTISGTTPVCQSQNGVAFSVGAISGATSYTWSYSGTGFTCASNCTTNSITANFSGTATGGNLTVYGTNACGNGTTSPNYAITVNAPPTTAAAGTDINPSCGVTTATLAGNTPSVGTGEWSVVSGTATITTSSSPTSGITGLAVPGTATLRWTIFNSPCTASTDDVVITTTACCGGTLTINHTVGTVAPETKSVNYGTVTSSISGASKCWITQNLGSTNQASSATDATDASAGWYWQFNRKQGYKVGPTPAWTITSINESSDWVAAQDPCTIELGTGWRIPTYTEWFNADGAPQNWASYTDTYNSVLKIHAAGYLDNSNGALTSRGANGLYWNSTQDDATSGRNLTFSSGSSTITNYNKAWGVSLRCLKD